MFVYINFAYDFDALESQMTELIRLEKHKVEIEKWLKDNPDQRKLTEEYPKYNEEKLEIGQIDKLIQEMANSTN